MRLSADPKSPFYDPQKSRGAHIYLNGERVEHAVAADDTEGWVDRYQTSNEGATILLDENKQPVLERVTGTVEIRLRSATPSPQ